jgi:hypothetical protein
MSAIPPACPKCDGEMIQGFVGALAGGPRWVSRSVSTWQEGQPKKSFWTGVKRPWQSFWTGKFAEDAVLPIGTFRCSSCGYLESYARAEFAPE